MNHNIHRLAVGSLVSTSAVVTGIVITIAFLTFTNSTPAFAQTVTPEPTGAAATEPYTYTVQVGDSWTSLIPRNGSVHP